MRLPDVLTLHRYEQHVGVEARDDVVGGVREQRVVSGVSDLRGGAARLAHRHPHERALLDDALARQHRLGEGLRLEQQRRVRRDDHILLDADLLEQPLRRHLPHRDQLHLVDDIGHRLPLDRPLERSAADRVGRRGNAAPLGDLRDLEIGARLAVIQDAAAAQQQQVEPVHLRADVRPQHVAPVDRAVDVVVALRVAHITGEDNELHTGRHAPQLREDRREDRLVADVETPVRPRDADDRHTRFRTETGVHPQTRPSRSLPRTASCQPR